MKINIFTILIIFVFHFSIIAQYNYYQSSIPTEIYVQDAYTKQPLGKVNIQLSLATNIKKYQTNDAGSLIVSLISSNDYKILVQKEGYYTQITSLSMNGFSRTKKNRYGISLRPKDCFRVKGKINLSEGSSLNEEATILFKNLSTNIAQNVKIQSNQTYVFCGSCHQEYLVSLEQEGLVSFKDTIMLEDENCGQKRSPTFSFNLTLQAEKTIIEEDIFTKGDTIKLEGFQFKTKTDDFQADTNLALENLSEILKTHPNLIVELKVHTDTRKSHRYNWTLSQKRAEKIIAFLESKNIDKKQYTVLALGEEEPINKCTASRRCSELEHQVNNRIEIHVLQGDKDI